MIEKTLNFRGLGLPWAVEDLLTKLIDANNALEGQVTVLQQQIAAMPKPPTMAEIAYNLSSQGSNPLNLSGLPGQ